MKTKKKLYLRDKNFLSKYREIKRKDLDWEWRTSSGAVFQDIQLWDNNLKPFWSGTDPKAIYSLYRKRPERRGIFVLVGNNLKSYSRGKIKNVYILYWLPVNMT
jgi:hypothetical protein